MSFSRYSIAKYFRSGFTLIELIVVIGILVVISGIVLTNHSRFGEQILLRSLAYDIALTFREAQVYGISARRIGDSTYASGHGISISIDNPTVLTRYFDLNDDNIYSGAGDEWAGTYRLSRAYRVENICGTPVGGSEECGLQELHVLFRRPDPDAIIFGYDGTTIDQYGSTRLVLVSPQQDRAEVLVETSGQISVDRYEE